MCMLGNFGGPVYCRGTVFLSKSGLRMGALHVWSVSNDFLGAGRLPILC